MRTRTHRTLLTATAACTALLFTAAGCTEGDEPTPEPTPTTSSAAPSPTTSAWEDEFSPKEIKAYEAALGRFTEYEQRSEPIWASGKVTPEAEDLLKEYWITWPVKLNTLRTYQEDGVKVIGTATVVSSEPQVVRLGKDSAVVEIKQCIDPSTISVEVTKGETQSKKVNPYIRTIYLSRSKPQAPFRIAGVEDITTSKKVTPCDSQ